MSNVTTLLDAKSVPAAKAALICPTRNETYSYGKLLTEMNRVGLGLLSLGIRKGDRVCIYLDSSPKYLISYFTIWRIGAVAVPTNIVYRGNELLHVINNAGACTVITDLQGAKIIGTIRREAPGYPLPCPLAAWHGRAAEYCPGDHLRRRPAPAGGLGSLQ